MLKEEEERGEDSKHLVGVQGYIKSERLLWGQGDSAHLPQVPCKCSTHLRHPAQHQRALAAARSPTPESARDTPPLQNH